MEGLQLFMVILITSSLSFENEQRRTVGWMCVHSGKHILDPRLNASRCCSLILVASSLEVASSCPVVLMHQSRCPTSPMQEFHRHADQRPKTRLLLQYHCEIQQPVCTRPSQLERTCGFRKYTDLLPTLTLNLPSHPQNKLLETIQLSIVMLCFPRGNIVCMHSRNECVIWPIYATSFVSLCQSSCRIVH